MLTDEKIEVALGLKKPGIYSGLHKICDAAVERIRELEKMNG